MVITGVSAIEMFDVIDAAVNGTEFENGKVDAVAHVGMMIAGTKTTDEISDAQDEILGAADESYILGYTAAWREIYHMLF